MPQSCWRLFSSRIPLSFALLLAVSTIQAEPSRPLSSAWLPDDMRLGPLKDLNGYFPFVPCKSQQEWTVRAERIRRQLLVATGLWPMPAPTPPAPWSMAASIATATRSRRSSWRAFPAISSPAIYTVPRAAAGGCRPCSRRTGIGPTGDSTTPAKRNSASRSPKGPSDSSPAAAIRSRPAACNLPAWAASSSITTWWAMPTACNLPHRAGVRPAMNTPRGLGLFQPAGRGPPADDHGPADVQFDPGPGLARRA